MSLKDRMELDAFKTATFLPHRERVQVKLGAGFAYDLDETSFMGKAPAFMLLSGNQLPALEIFAEQIAATPMVKEALTGSVKALVLRHEKDVRTSWDGMKLADGTLTISLDWEECYLPDSQLMDQLTKML